MLTLSAQVKEQNLPIDPPLELKQRILKMVIDEIILDMTQGWLQMHGAVRGTFPIGNTPAPAASTATR